ncbi:hypothetical protein JXO59_03330 [candidate division KSB1 bacterium]|nr:hypothetical protein [candidate division KSB1 bacterium]
MKKIILVLYCFLIVLNAHSQPLSSEETQKLIRLNEVYARDQNPILEHAWLLYRTDDDAYHAKADSILNKFISQQDNDPESFTYGQWGWVWRDGVKRADLNNALFRAKMMLGHLWEQQNRMSAQTQANFIASCKALLEAAKRRWDTEIFDIYRDYVAYSNIFVFYTQALTLAGDRFDNARLKKTASSQWTRWYNHVSFFGIDEFASPTYNNAIFRALMNIHDFCHDNRIQRESLEIMDHLYLLQSALTHPIFKLPVSGISRDYRNFLTTADARSGVLSLPLPEGYTAPAEAVRINSARRYPFEVIGKASINPFIFRSYQLKDAAMGSMTGGACFQQQIHCMAAVGENEHERAVAFLQGSFTPVNGYTDQIGTSTLCVYNRLPCYWHFTQWRKDLSNYRDTIGEFGLGLSANWQEKLYSPEHIILTAYGYDLHIFPFELQQEKVRPSALAMKHRTTTSPRYHPRPRIFDEYVFPPEPDWFGAYLILVKSGLKMDEPAISYANEDGIMCFQTKAGHRIRLFIAEKGDTRQLYNVDPALIPLLRIIEPEP